MTQVSIPVEFLYEKQSNKGNVPRDVQDMPIRPDAEPALFDQYGTHHSLRQY